MMSMEGSVACLLRPDTAAGGCAEKLYCWGHLSQASLYRDDVRIASSSLNGSTREVSHLPHGKGPR